MSLKSKFFTIFFLAGVFGLFAGQVYATDISGDVWDTLYVADSPYNVTGNLRVPPESTLVIEPGCYFNFQGHYKFIVDGGAALFAIGTETDSITFTAEDTLDGWHGIRFLSADSTSTLAYCIIEYGNAYPYQGWDCFGGGIFCYYSSPTISHSLIRKCKANVGYWGGGGIACAYSKPLIYQNKIIDNQAVKCGGGIYLDGSPATIQGNLISYNSASRGGAIYLRWSSNVTIIDNELSNNWAESGGGLHAWSFSSLSVRSNEFVQNEAKWGGALYVETGSVEIDSNEISSNTTYYYSGSGGGGIICFYITGTISNNSISDNIVNNGVAGLGGGIFCSNSQTGQPEIFGNDIHDNNGASAGGGIYCKDGGNAFIHDNNIDSNSAGNGGGIGVGNASPQIQKNMITNNNSSNGGGIYSTSWLQIQDNIIRGNTGGGIEVYNSVDIISNIIADNKTNAGGGGITAREHTHQIVGNIIFNNDAGSSNGGGLYIYGSNSHSTIRNNTLFNNTALNGKTAYYTGSNKHVQFFNNIVWSDTLLEISEIYLAASCTLSFSYNDIIGGISSIMTDGVLNWGDGNIDSDPLLVDVSTEDFNLQFGSACIDAGDPNSPLDPDLTWADMGALYYDQGGLYGAIGGNVTAAGGGSPLMGAIVTVFQGGFEIISVYTNENGEYVIGNLSPGFYDLEASKEGYITQTIENVEVIAGQITPVDFVLNTIPCPWPPYLLSPASGEIITSVPIHLDWEDEPCVIAYRLEYSTDEDFLPGSNITVSVDLGNTSNYDFQLSNIAARIYWRVYARDNEVESDPSQTWYFDYQPSINQEITSAIIASPPGQSQFEQNSTVATELRLTSTYSGPISGRWTIDGDDLAYISETVESFTSITITGPALPTSDLGAHTLGAIIESPNLISAPQINYEVVEPDVGVPHKISLSAMPAIVLADGISQALLTARVEDQNGILVTSDNGRVISFSLSGDGTLPAPPTAVTESGVAQLYYTSGTSPGTATVTVEATGLVSGQVEISLVANDLDGLLTEYDYIVDKLSSLKIYSLGGIPLINSYDQEEADEFVDTKIRPGSPTPEDLESFQRLLLSEKALLYGYHYIYDPQGPLSDPDRVRGADEMWDMGVRNIARSLLVGLGVKRLVDEFIKTIGKSGLLKKFFQGKIKEKLMAYINKKITKFVLDILFVAKNLVRDEQTRGRIDLLFPVIKESISGLLNQQVDLVQLSGEPVLRVAGDQFALATFHVERTQYDLDNAAYWADNNIHTGSLESAILQVQNDINSLRTISEERYQEILQHENKYSSVNAIQSMQDFLDNAVHLKLWEAAKSLVEVVGAILDIKKMIHAPQAAAKGISGGDEMYVHAHKGVYDAFGQSSISTKVAPYPPGALRYSSTETSAELLAKLRQSQADYAEIVSLLVSKMMSGDTTGLEQLLEDFLIADSHYDMVLDAFVGMADAGYDSALAYIPCFDSVYKEIYTSAFTTKSDMISSLIYVFAFAIDPSDTTYIPDATNQLSLTIETMDSNYQSLSSNAGLLLSVPASPVLQVWSYSESEVLELDSATTLHFLVKNIGTGTSLGRYVHFATDSSLVLESPDSLSISDLEPQDSLMLSCTVRAVVPDSVFGPVTSGLVCVDVFSDNALTKSTVGSILIKLYSAGDANGDGVIDIGDVVYLINYLYRNGPAPNPLEAGDANYDAIIDIGDVVYLINYLYRGGPPPCN